jgi:hypothetical protein
MPYWVEYIFDAIISHGRRIGVFCDLYFSWCTILYSLIPRILLRRFHWFYGWLPYTQFHVISPPDFNKLNTAAAAEFADAWALPCYLPQSPLAIADAGSRHVDNWNADCYGLLSITISRISRTPSHCRQLGTAVLAHFSHYCTRIVSCRLPPRHVIATTTKMRHRTNTLLFKIRHSFMPGNMDWKRWHRYYYAWWDIRKLIYWRLYYFKIIISGRL